MDDPTPQDLPDERPQRRREYSGAGSTLGVAMLVVLLVGLAIWWFELRGGVGEGAATREGLGIVPLAEAQNTTGKPPAAQEGRVAPNFRLEAPDGTVHVLTEFRGSPVLVNFWASWCGPCRGETPDLQSFSEAHPGVKVLGVNQQESAATAKDFLEQFGVTYPVVLDSSGEVSSAYRIDRGLPVSLLLDREGVVQKIYYGRLKEEHLAEVASLAP